MTNEKLKEKIVDIINQWHRTQKRDAHGNTIWQTDDAGKLADILLYEGMKTDTLADVLDETFKNIFINEFEKKWREAEHRAKVAERAARILSKWLADKTRENYPHQAWLEAAQKQAEKELAEEGKDE